MSIHKPPYSFEVSVFSERSLMWTDSVCIAGVDDLADATREALEIAKTCLQRSYSVDYVRRWEITFIPTVEG